MTQKEDHTRQFIEHRTIIWIGKHIILATISCTWKC